MDSTIYDTVWGPARLVDGSRMWKISIGDGLPQPCAEPPGETERTRVGFLVLVLSGQPTDEAVDALAAVAIPYLAEMSDEVAAATVLTFRQSLHDAVEPVKGSGLVYRPTLFRLTVVVPEEADADR